MQVPFDPRPQYSGLGVVIASYDRGLPPLGSPAWQQVNSDRYILREGWPAPRDRAIPSAGGDER
jgi:hypothetical protein